MSATLARAMWMLLRTRLGLRGWRGPRLTALLRAPAGCIDAAQQARAERLAREVGRAARILPGTRCLARAIALVRLLRDEAIPARLLLGLRRDDGAQRAHAWVELDGRPLAEDPASLRGFEALTDAPPRANWRQ